MDKNFTPAFKEEKNCTENYLKLKFFIEEKNASLNPQDEESRLQTSD